LIDLHCHLLPGLDDGPSSIGEAVALAEAAVAGGTTVMVATPHIDSVWRVRPDQISARAAALRDALSAAGVALEVLTGAEIAISRLADLSASDLDLLRLGEGPFLLLECPLSPTAGDFDLVLTRILDRGERVVLAHPERSPLFQQEPERLVRLVEAGALCSLSAGAPSGYFGELVRRFAIDLLRADLVHDVSSDAHDARRRPPGLLDAFVAAEAELPGVSLQCDWFTRQAPAAILAGQPLPSKPAVTRAR
jgi:protein-tyrosine phosphatase